MILYFMLADKRISDPFCFWCLRLVFIFIGSNRRHFVLCFAVALAVPLGESVCVRVLRSGDFSSSGEKALEYSERIPIGRLEYRVHLVHRLFESLESFLVYIELSVEYTAVLVSRSFVYSY